MARYAEQEKQTPSYKAGTKGMNKSPGQDGVPARGDAAEGKLFIERSSISKVTREGNSPGQIQGIRCAGATIFTQAQP
jgi:hypothetical protein